MERTKRILGIFGIIIMLSISLSIGVFAEYESVSAPVDDTTYEIGGTYSVNGVDYFIEENGNVTVKGPALKGVPERVEILSKLGDYTVTSIGYGAFYNSKTVKEAVIPETVTLIDRLAFKYSGLTDIEIKGKNVHIKTNFDGTPMRNESEENWSNDVFIVSGYAIESFAYGDVVFGEDIVGIGENCFRYSGGGISKLTILNPDCYIPDSSGNLPSNATIYVYKDSTAHKYAQNYGYRFSLICKCDDTVFVPATSSYCNGTIGYSEGYWCDSCKIYASGGLIDTSFEHKDSDEDNICDLCKNSIDAEIANCGKCGDEAVWTLNDDGVLRITGTSDVYSYSVTNREPWYNQKNEIKAFIAEEGVRKLHGISFEGYQNLETAEMADTVLSMPKSFKDCTALKSVKISRSVLVIWSDCFRNCTSLENVFIPKNITEIRSYAFRNCTNLSDIDFETGYLSLQSDAFYGTAAYNNPDNIKDGFLYIDNCLIAEITPGATTLVLDEEITSIASGWDSSDSKVTEIVVYNYDCAFPNDTGALPACAHFKGYVGSTAWFYSSKDFVALEPHTHIEVIDIPAVAPTATEPGYTHFSHCAVCGETVTERELIDPNEYDVVDGDVVTAYRLDAATSENDGENIVVTFSLRHDVYTSNVNQTVIYKVGEVKLSRTEFTYNGKVQKPTVTVKDSKGESLVKGRDYKVTYSDDSKYSGKYSVTIDYIGNYAGGKTLYYKIIINAITPVVSDSSKDSITLSWTKGHSDLVYRVYSVDSSGNLTKIADTKSGSYEITSLKTDTEYRFLVRAYVKGSNGKTYWGEKGNVFTCETASENTSNGIINILMNLIAKIKAFLQKFFVSK